MRTRPALTTDDPTDGALTNAEIICNRLLALPCGVASSNGVTVNGGSVVVPAVQASSLAGLSHVVGVRSEVEVCRVHARRVVALVEDVEAIGNRSIVEFPRHSVCRRRGVRSGHGHQTVARALVGTCPQPALIRVACFDLGPEALGEGA